MFKFFEKLISLLLEETFSLKFSNYLRFFFYIHIDNHTLYFTNTHTIRCILNQVSKKTTTKVALFTETYIIQGTVILCKCILSIVSIHVVSNHQYLCQN